MANFVGCFLYRRPRLIRNPRAILALLTGLNLLNYLDRFVLSAVLKPLQGDLGLDNSTAGFLATTFLLGFFVTSPVFGHLADRSTSRGRRALIVVGVVVWSLATMASGLAEGPASLIAARVVVGVGEASFVTIAPTLIDEIAPVDRKNRWLALFYAATPVGSALGYLIGGAVVHATHSWRMAFFVAGVPGLGLGALCLFIDSPARRVALKRTNLVQTARRLLAIPIYRSVLLGQAAYTFALGGFAFWAPKYIADRYHLDDGEAAFKLGLVTVAGGAMGTLVGGRIGDRVTRGRKEDMAIARGNLSVCAIATGLGAPLAAVALGARSEVLFYAVLLPCEIALFVPGGPFNVAVLRSVPPELRASAMALSIFASHLLGDLWSPWLIGVFSMATPMAWAMLACPATYALAALFWWRGRRQPLPAVV